MPLLASVAPPGQPPARDGRQVTLNCYYDCQAGLFIIFIAGDSLTERPLKRQHGC